MGVVTVMEAVASCTFGSIPTPIQMEFPPVFVDGLIVGQITDIIPDLNVIMFGTCDILAAAGVPVCFFIPAGPWIPGDPTILVNGIPILSFPTELTCAFGGVIFIDEPGQFTVMAA